MNKQFFKHLSFIGILVLILISVSLLSMFVGSSDVGIDNFFDILLNQKDSPAYSILFRIRLPRIILGFAVGGALSLAGVILQGLFRNPLVEPYTLGISGGASLGVTLNIMLKAYLVLGAISFPLFGFLGALVTIFFVYFFSFKNRSMKIESMLLTGVMISFISSSIVMLITALSSAEDVKSIIFWIMGSLDEPNNDLIILAVVFSIIGLIISYFYAITLNAFSLGEEEAYHLGINVERTKKVLFIVASLLTGLSVSVAGVIGFVGLVIPHLIRYYTGPDHRILLISSFLAGSSFLILSDTIARTIISPMELPVGVITGIIGGAIFIYSLNKKR